MLWLYICSNLQDMLQYPSRAEPTLEERNRGTVNMGHSTLTGDEGGTGSRGGENEREDERPSNDENWKGRKVVKGRPDILYS